MVGREGVVVLPSGRPAVLEYRASSIRVVEVQHRGLSQKIGRAAAVGMSRVALDLGGASFVGFDEHREGCAAVGNGRRIEVGEAGDDLGGRLGIGKSLQ